MKNWLGVLALIASGRALAQLPKSQLDLQREAAHSWEPARVELRPERRTAEPRTMRIRVYATADYRAQTFEWSSRFRRLVARASAVLQAWPGVRLEIVDVRPWPRDSAGAPLGRLVEELEQLDPGRDVDWVVGLAVAVPSMPEQIHSIGMARTFGRHFVLRSLHDLAEYEVVRASFDQMSNAERERLMALRKAHKELVIFLHEWAHTLGLPHAQHYARIMNPTYHHGMSRLSETEARLVELGLALRDEPARWRREATAIVDGAPDPAWDPRDRDELKALLARAPAPPQPVLSDAERADVESAERDARAGRVDAAWTRLQPALAAHPSHATLQIFGCEVGAMRGVDPVKLEPLCARAAELSPDSAVPWLRLAEAQVRARMESRAELTVARAEERLARAGDKPGWRMAAWLRQQLLSPTLAIADAERAGRDDGEPMKAWAIVTRRRLAIPPDAGERGLPPEREGEYARALRLALVALDGNQLAAVEEELRGLEAFPSLPGPAIVRCGLALRRRALAAARAQCKEALARQDDAIPSQLVAAELEARSGRPKLADIHRRRAAELDR
jgi:hypothetical protein